jgi:sulfoxide reductase heme-binding subunit YedZ
MRVDLHGPGLWYATRAAGLVTLLMLTASVLLGVITAGRFSSDRWPRFLTAGLHRNISLLVLVFLALHVGTTALDTFVSIPVAAAFVPRNLAGHAKRAAAACPTLALIVGKAQ